MRNRRWYGYPFLTRDDSEVWAMKGDRDATSVRRESIWRKKRKARFKVKREGVYTREQMQAGWEAGFAVCEFADDVVFICPHPAGREGGRRVGEGEAPGWCGFATFGAG